MQSVKYRDQRQASGDGEANMVLTVFGVPGISAKIIAAGSVAIAPVKVCFACPGAGVFKFHMAIGVGEDGFE